MQIQIVLGQFLDANVYIVSKGDNCLIIDSGAKLEDVKEVVGNKKVYGVLLTHGHYDHSYNCNRYAESFDCKIYANVNIKKTLTDPTAIYSEDGTTIEDFSRFEFIEQDKTIEVGDFSIKCYYCPGHSICSECYVVDGVMFAGDVLFEKGIGRCDLKFSDKKMMYESLVKLETTEFDRVFSGHGKDSNHEMQMRNIQVYKKFLTR